MNNLDLAGLKFILTKAISFSRLCKIHLLSVTEDVMKVRSSIYTLISGWHTPVFIIGPQLLTSANLITIFVARVKRVAEIIQPVMIHLSNLCHSETIMRWWGLTKIWQGHSYLPSQYQYVRCIQENQEFFTFVLKYWCNYSPKEI